MIEVSGNSLRVAGPMVIGTATALKAEGEAAVAAAATVVDLTGVSDADSAAVAVLLAWVRAARDRNQQLAIINVPESIRSLAALYGVTELLPMA